MSRNSERDARLEIARRERILEAGFKMFAEKGIERVSLASISEAAKAGAATMYNYYENKVNLVIAISCKYWGEFIDEGIKRHEEKIRTGYTAYECIRAYADEIIRLYKEKPELLRFSNNFKTFVHHEGASQENLRPFAETTKAIGEAFHVAYEAAKVDKSIRTDLDENLIFSTVSMAMLATAERYAQGIVWADNHAIDHTAELENIRDMLLNWCKG